MFVWGTVQVDLSVGEMPRRGKTVEVKVEAAWGVKQEGRWT
jgi:hypothetical protein